MLYLNFLHLTLVSWGNSEPIKVSIPLSQGVLHQQVSISVPFLQGPSSVWAVGLGHQQKALPDTALHLCRKAEAQRHVHFSGPLLQFESSGFSPHVASYLPLCYVQQLCMWRRMESALLGAGAVHGSPCTGGNRAQEALSPPACLTLHRSHVAVLPRGPAPWRQQCVTSHGLGRSSPRVRRETRASSTLALDGNVIADHTDSDLQHQHFSAYWKDDIWRSVRLIYTEC